jgi:hypothetical protein
MVWTLVTFFLNPTAGVRFGQLEYCNGGKASSGVPTTYTVLM